MGQHIQKGVSLDTGTYMLTTGTRLANGSVLVSNKIFNILEDKITTVSLDMRQSTSDISVIGSFNSESIFNKDGKDVFNSFSDRSWLLCFRCNK